MSRRSADAVAVDTLTRRSVLAGGAALVGGAAGFSGVASAEITKDGLIPMPDRWADENIAGFTIHLPEDLQPRANVEIPECDTDDWPPENVAVYNVSLVNRKDPESPSQETTLYIDDEIDLLAGAIFVINTYEICESGFFHVELQRVGRSVDGTVVGARANVDQRDRPNTVTEGAGAIGPGFGVAGALAGALGLGGLLARRRGDE